MEEAVKKFQDDGNQVLFQICEGVVWMPNALSFSLRKTAVELNLKSKYLRHMPWRIAEAEDPEQAEICAQLLISGDKSTMTTLELWMLENILSDLQAVDIIEYK